MRVAITGISGFVGSWFAEYALEQGAEVFGLCRWRSNKENLKNILGKITLVNGDLMDQGGLVRILADVQPDYIMHFAAASHVPTSFDNPIATLQTNIIGTCNLLEAGRIAGIDARWVIVSSSECYGQSLPHEVPITEKNPLRPASPYGVSKCGEDLIGLQYNLSYGMPIVRTRLFTHFGARRGEVFFESAFAKQIAAAELGLQEYVVRVGNLDSVRTLLDVKDAVRAYWLVKDCTPDVYNIGGTEVFTVGEVLDKLLSMVPNKYEVVEDPKLLRPSDVTLQLPSVEKFRHATGWKPEIPIETTLRDLLNFWIDDLKINPWKAKIC